MRSPHSRCRDRGDQCMAATVKSSMVTVPSSLDTTVAIPGVGVARSHETEIGSRCSTVPLALPAAGE